MNLSSPFTYYKNLIRKSEPEYDRDVYYENSSARFRENLSKERDKKLIELYEDQNDHDKAVKNHRAAVPSSAPDAAAAAAAAAAASAGGGRVRQLFAERRKTTAAVVVKNGGGSNNNNRSNVVVVARSKSQGPKPAVGRDKSYPLEPIRKTESTDESAVFKSPDAYDGLFGKLPNIGGGLLSEKITPKQTPSAAFSTNEDGFVDLSSGGGVGSGGGGDKNRAKINTGRLIGKMDRLSLSANDNDHVVIGIYKKTEPAKKESPKRPPPLLAPVEKTTVPERRPLRPKKAGAAAAAVVVLAAYKSSSKPPPERPPTPPGMATCGNCDRRFAQDRLPKHRDICLKTSKKKRKVFDPAIQRLKDLEDEIPVLKKRDKKARNETKKNLHNSNKITAAAATTAAKPNWRKQHEEFIASIREAKKVKEHLAKGGKLSDLPPPKPSDTSHYTPCPHCGRKFNEAAAQRHIPKCAQMLHNKPKIKPKTYKKSR